MIQGILFFEIGGAQVIGNVTQLRTIIKTMKELLPQLEQQERDRVLQDISSAELMKVIESREQTQDTS